MTNTSSFNSFSLGNEYAFPRKRSAIEIQLVNPEESSIPFFKELREPHITMNSFENLVQATPFRKFSANLPMIEIHPRRNSSPFERKINKNIKSENQVRPRVNSLIQPLGKNRVKSMNLLSADWQQSKLSPESSKISL